MAELHDLPKLITFDGEARSGKGTIVQACKDFVRDELGFKVMLIDLGQVFRCLGVAAIKAGVDINDPQALDKFLGDDEQAEASTRFVKEVYGMDKKERDALIYTNEAGENSAKVGARPLSQSFKDSLLKKWVRDAGFEGFEVILLDGRALEETTEMLVREHLGDFVAHLYFICNPIVGALRTLGFAGRSYDSLSSDQKIEVDDLVRQITTRNDADRNRAVQPILPPSGAPIFKLPQVGDLLLANGRYTATIDTSAEMTKVAMAVPIQGVIKQALAL